ncbi:MAG: ribosome recycling factor, partial [Candidatus Hydrogenedentes bacterium]|nr:ribosome recycling factor [Candidatus Hydrogenedentota bacterium]
MTQVASQLGVHVATLLVEASLAVAADTDPTTGLLTRTAFEHVLATVRTGRAHTALVEHFEVEHYGQTMPLNQLATLATPDPTLITIQVWDQAAVAPITKAVQTSDLGLTPSNEGALIRLPVSPLTEERRRELVKQV